MSDRMDLRIEALIAQDPHLERLLRWEADANNRFYEFQHEHSHSWDMLRELVTHRIRTLLQQLSHEQPDHKKRTPNELYHACKAVIGYYAETRGYEARFRRYEPNHQISKYTLWKIEDVF